MKWEYLVLRVPIGGNLEDIQAVLNDAGRRGWQLTSCAEGHAFFKRQLEAR